MGELILLGFIYIVLLGVDFSGFPPKTQGYKGTSNRVIGSHAAG